MGKVPLYLSRSGTDRSFRVSGCRVRVDGFRAHRLLYHSTLGLKAMKKKKKKKKRFRVQRRAGCAWGWGASAGVKSFRPRRSFISSPLWTS